MPFSEKKLLTTEKVTPSTKNLDDKKEGVVKKPLLRENY